MHTISKPPRKRLVQRGLKSSRKVLHRLIEDDLILHASNEEYQDKVKRVYGGPKGAMLAASSMVSLHIPLVERIFRSRRFNLHGVKSILDIGSGAGQIARPY